MDSTYFLDQRERQHEEPGEYDGLDIPFRPWVKQPAVINARKFFFVQRVVGGQAHGEKDQQTTA